MRCAPFPPFAAFALLAACSSHEENKAAPANGQVSAEGQAEEGKIRVKGPGVDMTFVLPKAVRGEAKADKNSKILYPGSTIAGMAMVGGEPQGKAGGDSEVEVRFVTADPAPKVVAWYRDPARSPDFKLGGVEKQGDDIVLEGRQSDGHPVKIRVGDRAGGGAEGRVVIHHSD